MNSVYIYAFSNNSVLNVVSTTTTRNVLHSAHLSAVMTFEAQMSSIRKL